MGTAIIQNYLNRNLQKLKIINTTLPTCLQRIKLNGTDKRLKNRIKKSHLKI